MARNVNGAFDVFSCASTCRVWESNSVEPAMNFEPSAVMASDVDKFVTERLLKTVPEADSYKKTTLAVALVPLTPTIHLPSGVASKRLRYDA